MSVMLVDSKTYIKAYNTLVFTNDFLLKTTIVDTYTLDELKKEFQKLYIANQKSFSERYKEEMEIKMLEIHSSDLSEFDNLCQLLKSLRCIRYQIELKDFDYSFLERVINLLMMAIIDSLPEYENADWG